MRKIKFYLILSTSIFMAASAFAKEVCTVEPSHSGNGYYVMRSGKLTHFDRTLGEAVDYRNRMVKYKRCDLPDDVPQCKIEGTKSDSPISTLTAPSKIYVGDKVFGITNSFYEAWITQDLLILFRICSEGYVPQCAIKKVSGGFRVAGEAAFQTEVFVTEAEASKAELQLVKEKICKMGDFTDVTP